MSIYLTTTKAARLAPCHAATIRAWKRSGRLRCVAVEPSWCSLVTTPELLAEAIANEWTPQQRAANAVANQLIHEFGLVRDGGTARATGKKGDEMIVWWLCRQCGRLLPATELEYSDGDCPDCETDESLEPTRDPRLLERENRQLRFAAQQALMALEEGYDAPKIRDDLREALDARRRNDDDNRMDTCN